MKNASKYSIQNATPVYNACRNSDMVLVTVTGNTIVILTPGVCVNLSTIGYILVRIKNINAKNVVHIGK